MPPWTVVALAFFHCTIQCSIPGLLCQSVDLYSALVILNVIILLDGHESNIVLLSQPFEKRGTHNLPANAGWCVEMPFITILALVGSHKG
jgi:hypothetical protein